MNILKFIFCFFSFKFIDSLQFLGAGLDKLVAGLSKTDFQHLTRLFPVDKIDLLTRKGVFPYEYITDVEKLLDESLPDQSAFYSHLRMEGISNEDYQHAQKVWSEFNIKTMWEYHDLYLKTDVVLLTDVFETFRNQFSN